MMMMIMMMIMTMTMKRISSCLFLIVRQQRVDAMHGGETMIPRQRLGSRVSQSRRAF